MYWQAPATVVLAAFLLGGAREPPADGLPPEAAASLCRTVPPGAPVRPVLLKGYGNGGFAVRTTVPAAQAFFDNGMELASAFSHDAAVAAFAEAARLDPGCTMCRWGEAWAAGPTINYPIDRKAEGELAAKVAEARANARDAPAKERAMLSALAARYRPAPGRGDWSAKPGQGNRLFAKAMDRLATHHPDDDAIAVIAADAWLIAGDERMLPRAIALLETVLARNPDHTPAIHFYIHATEFAGEAGRAEAHADRLRALAPSASHLVHMPSHTWYRIGRYQDAADANVEAVRLGAENAARTAPADPASVWREPYHAHNVHFGIGAALVSGDGATALKLAEPLLARVQSRGQRGAPAFAQIAAGSAYFAYGRFATPAEVLALADPGPKLPFARTYWRYARGEAAARLGDARAVRAEAGTIRVPRSGGGEMEREARRVAAIGKHVLEGRAAMLERRPGAAHEAFLAAARLQEARHFGQFADPPLFWYPVRRDVAAVLLSMGRPAQALAEAERVLVAMPREPQTLALRDRARQSMAA